MKKDELEILINLGLSQREISIKLGSSHSNVRYWLKKHNLKTSIKQYNKKYDDCDSDHKLCVRCKKEKPDDEFYIKYKGIHGDSFSAYCKECENNIHTEKYKLIKVKMIEYKGGQCVDCNLKLEDSHYSVFDFHHLDPKEKDKDFKKIKYRKWERIKEELDKCVLLCSNCHRIRHAEELIIGKLAQLVQ